MQKSSQKGKIFKKPLTSYATQEIEVEFQHAEKIFQKLATLPDFETAQPLSHDATSISYVFLTLPERADTFLTGDSCPNMLMEQAGRLLACIHGADSDSALLHGDFVPHNLFWDGTKLFVIDPHPPEVLGFQESLLYGAPCRDLIWFAIAIASGIGYRVAAKKGGFIAAAYREFVRGYGHEKEHLPTIKLTVFVSVLSGVFKTRARSGFGITSGLLHAVGAMYWGLKFKGIYNEHQ